MAAAALRVQCKSGGTSRDKSTAVAHESGEDSADNPGNLLITLHADAMAAQL